VGMPFALLKICQDADDAVRSDSVCCNFYYSNQLDSAVLNAYLWTESKRNLSPLDAFSGLFCAQNAFAAGALPRTPLGELTALPRPPSCPSPKTLPPLSGLRASSLCLTRCFRGAHSGLCRLCQRVKQVMLLPLSVSVAAEGILKGWGTSRAEGQRIEMPRGVGCEEGVHAGRVPTPHKILNFSISRWCV